MNRRLAILLGTFLLAVPELPIAGEEARLSDNITINVLDESVAYGFVCRVLETQEKVVITPLVGKFVPDREIRFYDDKGNFCCAGVVKSSYPDMAYVAIEPGKVELLKKGFMASFGGREEDVRVMCSYSMNFPLIIDNGTLRGHVVPPNVIVLNYIENAMKPVYFRHYAHNIGCRTCHHRDLDTPCSACHDGGISVKVTFEECVRGRCWGCHKTKDGASADCVWCHK